MGVGSFIWVLCYFVLSVGLCFESLNQCVGGEYMRQISGPFCW